MSRARSMNLGALALAVLLGAAAAVAIGLQVWDHDLAWEFGGERYEFLASRALVLLGVLPLLGWVATLSLADLPPLQKWLGVLLRAVLMAALVLGLARLSRTTDSARISTVFLVDVSDSVTDEAIAEARGKVQAALDARGEHDVQLITFARHARVVPLAREATELPERLARHGDEAHTDAGAGSNMAAALQLAYGLFPPGHLRRAVLLSDGGQTEGDLLAEASRAREFDVRLFHHVYTQGAPEEVAVRDMTVPEQLRVGDPFPVRARVFSNYAAEARVRLYQGETLNGLDSVRDVTLTPGDNEIEFQSVVRVAGPVTYRLELQPRGEDRFPANNRFETTAVVPGKPSVLYVEGAAGRANYLSRALAAGEFDVDVRTPRSIPTSAAELERFDFFMLSDVSADEVSMSQMDAIERYVRDQGGGFMMAGGESGFGLGGWQGSRMERLLPVRMDAERRRNQPSLALALVIDRSGSMAGQKLELAKEAARATAEMLGADDYIMVVGFDSEPERIVRMQSARNRLRIVRDISRMTARGGTNIFPALDMAYQDLAVTRARVKHVIVLTDGQAPESGIAELVQVMRAEGITVTSVGLGSDVNRVLLEQVASLGGGRSYFTSDPHNVPRIFMRETTTVARSAAVEEYFQPMVVQNADFLRGIDIASAPFLHGYVATRRKPTPAQVILQSDLGEPILARWRVGLGWSMAWTSDVKNRWAVEWLRWPQFSRFWTQLVREHMRQRRRETLDMTAEVLDGEVRVTVDAIDTADRFMNDLESTLTVEGPMGAPAAREGVDNPQARVRETHALRQTAPGLYEARFPLERYGSFMLTASHERQGRPVAESTAQLANPYPREYLNFEPNRALLERATGVTGGGALDAISALFDPGDETIRSHEELWPKLLFLALGLFLLDLALRRVRLFDRDFRRPVRKRR
ncbi:MAG: VWA domain-containing protein [Sandaracinaceae bacterium]|nr:VWA domain-containing protein [Sandaracinaceae bacterium]